MSPAVGGAAGDSGRARRQSMTPATRNNAFVLATIASSVIFATRLTGYRERADKGGDADARGRAWWRRA